MGGTVSGPVLFVCGTPSDRGGFKWHALEGATLPTPVALRLDGPRDAPTPAPGERVHVFERVPAEKGGGALYKSCTGIQPSDTSGNRGAYITVGCWVGEPGDLGNTVELIHKIRQVERDLEEKRDPERHSFGHDFELTQYTMPPQAQSERQWEHGATAGVLHLTALGLTGALMWSSDDEYRALGGVPARSRTERAGPSPPTHPGRGGRGSRRRDVRRGSGRRSGRTREPRWNGHMLGELARRLMESRWVDGALWLAVAILAAVLLMMITMTNGVKESRRSAEQAISHTEQAIQTPDKDGVRE